MSPIKNLPIQERPREKALKNGVESLSDAELLAIIISSGCKNKSAIQLAMEMIIKHEGLYNVFNSSLYELIKFSGIDKIKAIKLLTIKELFVRFLQSSSSINQNIKISSGLDIYNYYHLKFLNSLQEKIIVFYLNNQNIVIYEQVLSIGDDTSSIISFKLICKMALEKYAKKVILCHNHPSGKAFPSIEDISTFYELKKALSLIQVKLLDHVILGNNEFYSIVDKQLFKVN